MSFTCDQCKSRITEGNIMVDAHDWSRENQVNAIEVWCKPCTSARDCHGGHATLHNVHELSEARTAPFALLASIIGDTLGDPPSGPRWSRAAANRVLRLCAEAHPALSGGAFLDGEAGSE